MTITATSPTYVQIPGNSSATAFAAPMKCFQATDVVVGFIVSGNYALQTSGYSVANVDTNGGFTVNFAVAPPTGTTVDIRTATPQTQPTEFANLGAYLPENTTEALDRMTRALQDVYRQTYVFGMHGPDTESVPWPTLPPPSGRANTNLGFGPAGVLALSVTLASGTLSQASIGSFLWPRSTQEIAAGVTPSYYWYRPGNALRYGMDPTNTSDNTAAMNTAHSTGVKIYYPAGTYKTTSGVIIPGGGISGDGAYQTTISSTDATSTDILKYTGQLGGNFNDFELFSSVKTAGYGINVNPPAFEVSAMRFFQCVFSNVPSGIHFMNASRWTVIACQFYTFTGDGITVDNTYDADSGDSCITNCDFENVFNVANASNGIRQIASGGLKITACKFNNMGVGYLLDLGAGSTSDLLITNCSFENYHFSGIQFQRTAGAAQFANVALHGNQFYGNSSSGNSAGIYSNNPSTFLYRVAVTGNVMFINDTVGATGIFLNNVQGGGIIDGNCIQGNSGSATIGLLLGALNVGVKLGVNQVNNFHVNHSLSTNTDYVASDFQSGTGTITCNTAIGSLFYGTATVTLPIPFTPVLAPNLTDCGCMLTSAGAGGGISADVLTVSPTQIILQAVSVTSGGVVPVAWGARGLY